MIGIAEITNPQDQEAACAVQMGGAAETTESRYAEPGE
jgi:hypothetical protein